MFYISEKHFNFKIKENKKLNEKYKKGGSTEYTVIFEDALLWFVESGVSHPHPPL